MKHQDKVKWMTAWAETHEVTLDLQGKCGFGRECVGILAKFDEHWCFPDFAWFDDNYKRLDDNGDVWVPEDAYHKHECLAVLGHGEKSESQLYDWLKWFDDNNFVLEVGQIKRDKPFTEIECLLGKHFYARMVKQ